MRHRPVSGIHSVERAWPDQIEWIEPATHIDNEYSRAGIQDPKIVITTSRDPSSKLLQFSKVLTLDKSLMDKAHAHFLDRK
jgi:hypothetical protein